MQTYKWIILLPIKSLHKKNGIMNYRAASSAVSKLRQILKDLQLTTMYLLVLFSLIFDIVLDDNFIPKSSNRIEIITTCPKLSSPEFLFHLRVSCKQFSGRNTFCYLHKPTHHHWNCLDEKMNMVDICSYFNEIDFIALLDFLTNLLECLCYLVCEYVLSVPCWTHQMKQK